jgi:hypothetical protein
MSLVLSLERIQNRWQRPIELHVDNSSSNLPDTAHSSIAHLSLPQNLSKVAQNGGRFPHVQGIQCSALQPALPVCFCCALLFQRSGRKACRRFSRHPAYDRRKWARAWIGRARFILWIGWNAAENNFRGETIRYSHDLRPGIRTIGELPKFARFVSRGFTAPEFLPLQIARRRFDFA